MIGINPLQVSRSLLGGLGIEVEVHNPYRLPETGGLLVVSNHRSMWDAPLLMLATNRSIRFACHHYMGQVPGLREIVTSLGCFPLESADQRQHSFLQQATQLLQQGQTVGVFPEGGQPMVHKTQPQEVGTFHRGFAHLALRVPVEQLWIVPVAIASVRESVSEMMPLSWLSWFDPSEPLFQQPGWHPLVWYHHVRLLVGKPQPITPELRQQYQGKGSKSLIADFTAQYQAEIATLIHQGFY